MSTTKQILEYIIKEKSQGNTFQELNVQMRIMMKGVNVKSVLSGEEAESSVLTEKLKEIAKEFEVDLNKMK